MNGIWSGIVKERANFSVFESIIFEFVNGVVYAIAGNVNGVGFVNVRWRVGNVFTFYSKKCVSAIKSITVYINICTIACVNTTETFGVPPEQ